ncbi:hypothetical protein BC831DRAFT_511646 [Entophlyctis helioformis]|nr:hypothetical protein BC831DRAFT_511646 [Entophlyctis helioformis]
MDPTDGDPDPDADYDDLYDSDADDDKHGWHEPSDHTPYTETTPQPHAGPPIRLPAMLLVHLIETHVLAGALFITTAVTYITAVVPLSTNAVPAAVVWSLTTACCIRWALLVPTLVLCAAHHVYYVWAARRRWLDQAADGAVVNRAMLDTGCGTLDMLDTPDTPDTPDMPDTTDTLDTPQSSLYMSQTRHDSAKCLASISLPQPVVRVVHRQATRPVPTSL